MRVLSCPREDCDLERVRKALRDMRAEREAKGFTQAAESMQVVTCKLCGMTRGWKRNRAGEEREIDQDVIWGRHKGSDAA